ncbi:hypothetical protein M3665_26405, partial [Bacillus licheniformis]|nr:hypothetical protein [Bacillus licheniformis]
EDMWRRAALSQDIAVLGLLEAGAMMQAWQSTFRRSVCRSCIAVSVITAVRLLRQPCLAS